MCPCADNGWGLKPIADAMNAIVAGVLAREAAKAQTDPHPLSLIGIFCGLGLVVAITMAAIGFDLGAGFF